MARRATIDRTTRIPEGILRAARASAEARREQRTEPLSSSIGVDPSSRQGESSTGTTPLSWEEIEALHHEAGTHRAAQIAQSTNEVTQPWTLPEQASSTKRRGR